MITREWADEHIGAGVVYDPGWGGGKEDGTIVRSNDRGVFVRYSTHPNTPQMTNFEDLTALTAGAS